MVCPDSRLFSRGRRYLGCSQREPSFFRLRGCHPLWPAFPDLLTRSQICKTLFRSVVGTGHPTTPRMQIPHNWHMRRFRLFRFRSPLLTESMLFLFPCLLRCFNSARVAPPVARRLWDFIPIGFPHSEIHGSKPAQRLTVAYRSSQRPSSPLGAKASPMHP